MIGQVAAWVVLLAVGCNVITGVGDLKVYEGCGPDAGAACDTGSGSTTEVRPLEPPPDDGTGGTGLQLRDGGTSGGGNHDCGSSRDVPPIFSPMNVMDVAAADGCGPVEIPILGGNGNDGGSGGSDDDADAGGGVDGPPPLSTTTCAAGSVQACAGAGNCAGLQICLADGSGYSSCQCAPMPVAVSGSIAAACATDADCAAGLTCTTSADIDGLFSNGAQPDGPQNGYCSRSCNTDAECQAADPGTICLGPDSGSGPGLCTELCDADSDCEQQAAGWTCTPWPIELILAYPQVLEHDGFCQLAPGGGDGDGDGTGKCSEDCLYTGDGDCDDGGPGSDTRICPLGTDCLDCGAR